MRGCIASLGGQRGLLLLSVAAVLAISPMDMVARPGEKNDLLVQESQFNRGVRDWFATEQGRSLLGSRQLVEITLRQAVERALAENLSLKKDRIQENVAEQVMVENSAAFDPVFNANLNTSMTKNYSRVEKDKKFKKATTECIGGCNDPDWAAINNVADDAPNAVNNTADDLYVVYDEGSPVSYLRYDSYRAAGYYDTTIQASKSDKFGPVSVSTFSMGLNDPLPWGMSVNVTESTVYKATYYALDGGPTDPKYGSYKRPWISNLSVAFNTPIPGTKDFGALAAREVNLEQSSIGRQRASINSQYRANDLINKVENAYWDLVNVIGDLDANLRNRKTVEALFNKTNRMFNASRVTASDKAQVEARLANAMEKEIQSANAFIQVSNRLNQLLNFQGNTLFLPVGYVADLQKATEFSLDETLEKGRKENIQNRLEENSLSAADLTLRQRQQQTRPDLNFTLAVNATQNNSKFGYKDVTESLMNLSDPDAISIAGTAAYKYPVGNGAANAYLGQAQADHARRQAAKLETGNRVDRDILNAFASLNSAREQAKISTRNLELAETAYNKAISMQELDGGRRVTEYELLVKNEEVFNARLRYLKAMVDTKRNESALNAAMGALEGKYSAAGADKQVAQVATGGSKQ
ncbi:MAG: TolC family protein [Magnetococcales bacterium]|nr:TolC family protein [Magnetococcales bacterium]NGZ27337.1 TolC family protein [Magnetococcales bacterium]